jgi:hypothetical protein
MRALHLGSRRRRIAAVVLLLAAATLPAAPSQAQASASATARLRSASYDGTWNGTVKCLYDPGLWPEDECDIGFTLEIDGKDFRVHQRVRSKNGQVTTSEVKPGAFSFSRLATNAVAVSMASSEDEDGTWVETWSFVMTLQDPDHMIVHWTRVVNNVDMPPDRKGSKFSSVGMGVLARRAN